MNRLLGKKEKSEHDSTDQRLKGVERKLNVALLIILLQLLVSVAQLFKDTFLPSPFTFLIVSATLICAAWFFRGVIFEFFRKKLLQSLMLDANTQQDSKDRAADDSN